MVKRDAKYRHVKSAIGQYIRGRVRAEDVFVKSKYFPEATAAATSGPSTNKNLYALENCKKCNRKLRHQLTNMNTAAGMSSTTTTTNSPLTPTPSQCTLHSFTTCDNCTEEDSSEVRSPSLPRPARPFRTAFGKEPASSYAALHSIVAGNTASSSRRQFGPASSKNRPKAFIEECGPDLLCLNFAQEAEAATQLPRRRKTPAAAGQLLQEQRAKLADELDELKKMSCDNEQRIGKLFKRLNSLKLSITLLQEEQQRLQHSKQIRAVNMKLLVNMLRSKLEGERKGKCNKNYQRFDAETRIVRKLFEKLATLEELKMKLEYENTRSLYAIKELKRENARLEEKRRELASRINVLDSV